MAIPSIADRVRFNAGITASFAEFDKAVKDAVGATAALTQPQKDALTAANAKIQTELKRYLDLVNGPVFTPVNLGSNVAPKP